MSNEHETAVSAVRGLLDRIEIEEQADDTSRSPLVLSWWFVKKVQAALVVLMEAEVERNRLARGHDEYNRVNQILEAENDELLAERAELKLRHHDDLLAINAGMEVIAAERARVAELEADAARIDWREAHPELLVEHEFWEPSGRRYWIVRSKDADDTTTPTFRSSSYRLVIDIARLALAARDAEPVTSGEGS